MSTSKFPSQRSVSTMVSNTYAQPTVAFVGTIEHGDERTVPRHKTDPAKQHHNPMKLLSPELNKQNIPSSQLWRYCLADCHVDQLSCKNPTIPSTTSSMSNVNGDILRFRARALSSHSLTSSKKMSMYPPLCFGP